MSNVTFSKHILRDRVVDTSTGEIKVDYERQRIELTRLNASEFHQVYSAFLGAVYRIKPIKCQLVLSWLSANVSFGKNSLEFTLNEKKRLCTELDIKLSSLNNLYWPKLKEATFVNEQGKSEKIIHVEGTTVWVNPKITWKGKLKDLHSMYLEIGCGFEVSEEDKARRQLAEKLGLQEELKTDFEVED